MNLWKLFLNKKAPGKTRGILCLNFRCYLTTVSCLFSVSRHTWQQLVVILYSTDILNSSQKQRKSPSDKPRGQNGKVTICHRSILLKEDNCIKAAKVYCGCGYMISTIKFKREYQFILMHFLTFLSRLSSRNELLIFEDFVQSEYHLQYMQHHQPYIFLVSVLKYQ